MLKIAQRDVYEDCEKVVHRSEGASQVRPRPVPMTAKDEKRSPMSVQTPPRSPLGAWDLPDEVNFVVVGAGAAGCVLAARLSEDPNCLASPSEAGDANDALACAAPAQTGKLSAGDASPKNDATVPLRALGGWRVPMPAGKGPGGSSINATVRRGTDARGRIGPVCPQGPPGDVDEAAIRVRKP